MNKSIAIITALAFLSLTGIYNLTYGLVNMKNPKIAKKWIWFRIVLSFSALCAAALFARTFLFAS